MRDADARERLDALEQALANLPAQVTEVVIAHFEPVIAEVNKAVAELSGQTKRLDVLAAAVTKLEGHGELMEVVESELNALRVDVNGQREAAVAIAAQVAGLGAKLGRVAKVFSEIGTTS